jgi:hypothetical protein
VTEPKKPAAAKKAAAAAAETSPQPKTVQFRGLVLELPPVLSGSLYFDFAELEDDSANIGAQVRLLKSRLGDEQVRTVRDKIAADGVPFDEVEDAVVGLFDAALDAYGVGMGESSASADS